MAKELVGKKILVVKGSLLSMSELDTALKEQGAAVQLASNIISAFAVLEHRRFDGAILDKGLHNEAFDLCAELRELEVPHILSDKPHELQKAGARRRATTEVVEDLILTMRLKDDVVEPASLRDVAERPATAATSKGSQNSSQDR
jgi:DNA-binding response OmpR family regulator